jgi:hypothetical protein
LAIESGGLGVEAMEVKVDDAICAKPFSDQGFSALALGLLFNVSDEEHLSE